MQYQDILNAGYKTEAACVASILKKELKEKFPGIKFSVKSETFSGGDSVSVRYQIGENAPKVREVERVTDKFKGGYFDGMNDIYEYTYKGDGPTVKFLSVYGDAPAELRKQVEEDLRTQFGFTPEEWASDQEVMKRVGCWRDQFVWREISKRFYEIAK